jgi:recombinational DNA repair ATPase RecF
MKIIEFKAERFKRLSAVEIVPDGDVVVISGRNAQGKSSVLDAIWLALGGAPAAKDSATVRPVKDGERDAVVRLDFGEIVVTRRWTAAGNSTLTVEGANGKKFTSPQALLDSLVGKLSFDPLAFSRMSPKEQRKALVDLVKMDVDPDALDAERKAIYDERTDANRELKNLEARLSGMKAPEKETPAEEASLASLLEELKAARAEADSQEAQIRTLTQMRERASALQAEIEAKQKELATLVEKGRSLAGIAKAFKKPDLDGIASRIQNIEKTNASVRSAKEYRDISGRIESARKNAGALTARIEALDRKKEQAFAAAKFPVADLAFDAEGVTYGGIPFGQCSSAEQMRVSIAIAAALNPKIRVIRVSEGALLDSESMAEVARLAKEQDMQIWIERVDESGQVGVVIEDGATKTKDAAKANAAVKSEDAAAVSGF